MYKALYRKWRPKTFDDVCGQEGTTEILKYEVANNKISHAYLFCGSRGTGKTSCAKILAKAINCEHTVNGNPCNQCEACMAIDAGTATDVIEMDAASNTGVDNVRDMKEEIVFTPAFLKYRVYIIDEVHMMSGGAFNALLKTLEEPPGHAVFILATTELQKLPSTIISRCQRFDFRRMTSDVIVNRLMYVANEEGLSLLESGARLIAKTAQGGMRDALSLLELCGGMKENIDEALVIKILGVGNRQSIKELVLAISAKKYSDIYDIVSQVVLSAKDLSAFWREVIDYYRDLIVTKVMPTEKAKDYLDLTSNESEELFEVAKKFSMEQLLYHSKLLEEALGNMQKMIFSRQSIAELTLTRMCEPKLSSNPESMLARISELESAISAIKLGVTSIPAETLKNDYTSIEEGSTSIIEEKHVNASSAEKQNTHLHLCSSWSEIVENLSETKKSLSGLLLTAQCFVDSQNNYIIKVNNAFTQGLIMRDDAMGALKCAIASVDNITPNDIIVEVDGTVSSSSLIEELEKNI